MDPVDPLNAPAASAYLLSCTGMADFRSCSGVCTGDHSAIRETGTLICAPVCQVHRARRRPGPSSWAPPLWPGRSGAGGERVDFDAWSTLMCADWLPQGGYSAGVGRSP